MRARFAGIPACLLGGLVVFSACADDSSISAPEAAPRSVSATALAESAETVESLLMSPVHRLTGLAEPVTWSFTAGPDGVQSSHAATGLTISIPSGALSSNVTITVTALSGTAVAYAFAPHGLEFAKDVWLTQSLDGTEAGAASMVLPQGGHFAGDEPEYVESLAAVTETSVAQLDLVANSMTFPIRHFSGWIAGSGRSEQ